jgi:putative membrane protein
VPARGTPASYARVMVILVTIAATLSAVLHIVIFYWESYAFSRPTVWRRFGLSSQEEADQPAVKALMYNQGYYNLFLAVGALLGGILYGVGVEQAGFAIGLFSVASMLAAAIVLTTTGPGRIKPAIVQGTLPLITVILYIVGWLNPSLV